MKKKQTVVLIQGAFEILNYGHVKTLKRLKGMADVLVVALNTDHLLRRYKGREPVLPYKHKKEILEAIRWVDKVVPAHDESPMALLKKHSVDIYALTREWEKYHPDEIAYMKKKGGKVYFSRRYSGGLATSEVKNRLLQEAEEAAKNGKVLIGNRYVSKSETEARIQKMFLITQAAETRARRNGHIPIVVVPYEEREE